MDEGVTQDHYEVLQISKNADADTVQRVFRLLARRYHPDNSHSGNEARFRQIHEAYLVLSDPEKRAAYDVRHETLRQEYTAMIQALRAQNERHDSFLRDRQSMAEAIEAVVRRLRPAQ